MHSDLTAWIVEKIQCTTLSLFWWTLEDTAALSGSVCKPFPRFAKKTATERGREREREIQKETQFPFATFDIAAIQIKTNCVGCSPNFV